MATLVLSKNTHYHHHPAEVAGWGCIAPSNSVWYTGNADDDTDLKRIRENGKGPWAMGLHRICEVVKDGVPDDALATWTDDDQVQFCIRPRPADLPEHKDVKEREARAAPLMLQPSGVPITNSSLAVFRIGRGVLVKAKYLNYGSAREGAAMELIRDQAPSVPVPEVMCHWRDPDWFCYFYVMREMPGIEICSIWYSLQKEHQERLAREVAVHMDLNTDHFLITDGLPLPPPRDKDSRVYEMPLERQANLHVSGIIDWEYSGFFPRFMVVQQFLITGQALPYYAYQYPMARADEFREAVARHLVELGGDDPNKDEFKFESEYKQAPVPEWLVKLLRDSQWPEG